MRGKWGAATRRTGPWSKNRPWFTWTEFVRDEASTFSEWAEIRPDYYRPHVAIIDSVSKSGLSEHFAMNLSHMDPTLSFALALTEPTMRDCIVIPGFGWDASASPGNVRIFHVSYSGQVEDIERPVSDAVPLFWRFVAEKFGIYYDHKAVQV